MTFYSKYATKIWDKLYTVNIPDQVTLNPDYIERFGVYVTSDENVNKMLSTNFTSVMIPVIKILEYFLNGIEIQIPSREDMLTMHKDIEAYLGEWEVYIKTTIHGKADLERHKNLIVSLEKLSKYIYNKAGHKELIETNQFGLVTPLQKAEEDKKIKDMNKPDYVSIMNLIKGKGGSRF